MPILPRLPLNVQASKKVMKNYFDQHFPNNFKKQGILRPSAPLSNLNGRCSFAGEDPRLGQVIRGLPPGGRTCLLREGLGAFLSIAFWILA